MLHYMYMFVQESKRGMDKSIGRGFWVEMWNWTVTLDYIDTKINAHDQFQVDGYVVS